MGGCLTGCRILVVEDDPLIAMSLEYTLSDAGAEVIGPAHTVAQALDLIDGSAPDAGLLNCPPGQCAFREQDRSHEPVTQ